MPIYIQSPESEWCACIVVVTGLSGSRCYPLAVLREKIFK